MRSVVIPETSRRIAAAAVLATLAAIAPARCHAQAAPANTSTHSAGTAIGAPPSGRDAAKALRPERRGGLETWWTLGAAGLLLVGAGVVRLCQGRGLARGPRTAARLEVIARTALGPRHAVFALRFEGRVLVIGTGSQGAPSLLAEMGERGEPSSEAGVAVPAVASSGGV